ncbi:MAG: hypothetical protein HQK77_03020 [Desulfobacterales bacterium]|nr:hypothetical protein [Desulfobacterales bacterium]
MNTLNCIQKKTSRFHWGIWITLLMLFHTTLGICEGVLFSSGKDMNTARMGHENMMLSDGRVFVFGGHGTDFVSLRSAELFDPKTNSFTEIMMNYPHDWGASTVLLDGRILIAGGSKDLGIAPGYSTAEIYDPSTNRFTSTSSSMNYARTSCRAATLSNGKVLIVGGWYDVNAATYGELFDPVSGTFTVTQALKTPRALPVVLATQDGKAVVFGGVFYYGGTAYESVEVYDPNTNTFTDIQDTLFQGESGWLVDGSFSYQQMQQLSDGKYVFMAHRTPDQGVEYTLFTFDPVQTVFKKIPLQSSFPEDLTLYPPVVSKKTNQVYLLGVVNNTNPVQIRLCTVDTSTGKLSLSETYTLSSNHYLSSISQIILQDGRILVSGGHSQTGYDTNFSPVKSTFLITPETTTTTTTPDVTPATCQAILNQDISLHIPIIEYSVELLGRLYLWADFAYDPFYASKIMFKLTDYGFIEDATRFNCTKSELLSTLLLHIPEFKYQNQLFWADLQYDTTVSNSSNYYFAVNDFGIFGETPPNDNSNAIGTSGGEISFPGLHLTIPQGAFSDSKTITIQKADVPSEPEDVSDTYTISGLPSTISGELVLEIESKVALDTALADRYHVWFEFEENMVAGINYIPYAHYLIKAEIINQNKLKVTLPPIDFQSIAASDKQKSHGTRINTSDFRPVKTKVVITKNLSTAHFTTEIKESDEVYAAKTLQYLEEVYTRLGNPVDQGGLGFNWTLNNCRMNESSHQYEKIPIVFADEGENGNLGAYNPGLLGGPCRLLALSAVLEFNTNPKAVSSDDKLRTTAAHELFHFLQAIYNTQTVTEPWAEASSMWIETLFTTSGLCPSSQGLYQFTWNGLLNVYKTAVEPETSLWNQYMSPYQMNRRWHGYGAASFLMYGISKGVFNLQCFWNGLHNGIGETAALQAAIVSPPDQTLTLGDIWRDFAVQVYGTKDTDKINSCLPAVKSYRWSKTIQSIDTFPVTYNFDAYALSAHSYALVLKAFDPSETDLGMYFYANGLLDNQEMHIYDVGRSKLLGIMTKSSDLVYVQNFEQYKKQQVPLILIFIDKNIPSGTNPSAAAQDKTNTVNVYIGQGPYLTLLYPKVIEAGKELNIYGFGYGKNADDITINFSGASTDSIGYSSTNKPGFEVTDLRVSVPTDASTGNVTVKVLDKVSNALPLEVTAQTCGVGEGSRYNGYNAYFRVKYKDCSDWQENTWDMPLCFKLGPGGTIIPDPSCYQGANKFVQESLTGSWYGCTIELSFTSKVNTTVDQSGCWGPCVGATLTFTGTATITVLPGGKMIKHANGTVDQTYTYTYECCPTNTSGSETCQKTFTTD